MPPSHADNALSAVLQSHNMVLRAAFRCCSQMGNPRRVTSHESSFSSDPASAAVIVTLFLRKHAPTSPTARHFAKQNSYCELQMITWSVLEQDV